MTGKINKFWLALAALLALLVLAGCIYAALSGSLYISPGNDAQETVIRFFDAVESGQYENAYACLSDYASLGLENMPDSPESQLLYEALRASYDYSLVGECEMVKLNATQVVRFRSLNIGRVQSDAARLVDGILEELAEARPEDEFYDEEGRLFAAVTDEAYQLALERTLENAEDYYTIDKLQLSLRYVGGQWIMSTTPALLSAISGGSL